MSHFEFQINKWVEKHHWNEWGQFDRIKDKMHPLKDVCAMMYLFEKLGNPEGDEAIGRLAGTCQLFLSWGSLESITEDDVIYLLRCGVSFESRLFFPV